MTERSNRGSSSCTLATELGLAGRAAVVDIGSNTVRMVVFEGGSVTPVPMFNEKVACGLGRGVGKTNRLNPEGVVLALETLTRFSRLIPVMGIERVDLLATAAVRDSEDGPAFAQQISDLFGQQVQILSGGEEAMLSAHGVLLGHRGADGLVGDMGGGSLDLVELNDGCFGDWDTMPLGHLRLTEAAENGPSKLSKYIEKNLSKVGWLKRIEGRTLYAVGGSWRSVGQAFMDMTNYPLHVLDGYTVARADAETLLGNIASLSRKDIEAMPHISRKRVDSVQYTAMVMARLIQEAQPRQIVFCGYGMREGQFAKSIPEEQKTDDSVISACKRFAAQRWRFGVQGQEIFDWISPLFPHETGEERRMRLAACLLSDISWFEHPDYRAEHAFQRVLRLPFAGLNHNSRALMALAVSLRYDSDRKLTDPRVVQELLSEHAEARARAIGAALRLAYLLSGGAPGLLQKTGLTVEPDGDGNPMVHLILPTDGAMFTSDAVNRRFLTLAKALGGTGVVTTAAQRRDLNGAST